MRTPEGGPIPPNTIAKLKRDMERLRQIKEQIRQIEAERLERIEKAPEEKAHVMIVLLARVLGMGVETADMLVREALSRNLRDRRAVARLGGLTGSPDESGSRRREKGLARAGNARLRTGMIQLAWRMVMFQKDCALVQWFIGADSRWPPADAKNHDRGACPQIAYRFLAHGDDRRSPQRHDLAASSVITSTNPIVT